MNPSGHVEAGGNISARDITTGLKIENLNVVLSGLDELARLLDQAGQVQFRPAAGDSLELLVAEQSRLSLPPNLLEAFKQLPQAGDLPPA